MSAEDLATSTIKAIAPAGLTAALAVPGLVVIFSRGQPACAAIELADGSVVLGRTAAGGVPFIDDAQVSRRHAQVTLTAEGVHIADLGSRNGTFVDGQRVGEARFPAPPRVLRMGSTLIRFTPDIAPFLRSGMQDVDGAVVGPTLRSCHDRIARAATAEDTLLLTGPSGAGKELGARAFHAAAGRAGPLVAVNCAAIPSGLAERLLFGARRGAYSGATADAAGYVQAADGGTLFLDEIAELDPAVQPKLLRVLESREVTALGDTRARKVDVRLCAATLKDLRAEVAAGRFREDLYYRIGRPEVRIPALVDRLEELPWLACAELRRVDPRLAPSPLFLEACALRPWPGNLRELLLEVRQAGRAALDDSRTLVEARDLSPSAGRGIADAREPAERSATKPRALGQAEVEAALRAERGNVTRAARALGVHRNQVRRWLARHHLNAAAFGRADEDAAHRDDDPADTSADP